MKIKNYGIWVVIGLIFVACMSIPYMVGLVNPVKIQRQVEYVILKSTLMMAPNRANAVLTQIAERRYRYQFYKLGQFPSDIKASINVKFDEECGQEFKQLVSSLSKWESVNRPDISKVYNKCGNIAFQRGKQEQAIYYLKLGYLFNQWWKWN